MADQKKKTSDDKPVIDKRLSDRLVARGKITRDELEKHLKDLPDLTDKADNIAGIIYPHQG
jgi:polyhydroxyalkanoate synthesis regulator phasin